MKVLLLKDVGGVGVHGTIREVADGYAYNFLIARGLAVQATPDRIAAHAAQMKQIQDAQQKKEGALKLAVQGINNARVELSVRATEKGGLFKSITAGDVVKAIVMQHNVQLPESAVELPKPIKEVGEHILKIRAGGAESTITFAVKAA